MPCVPATLLAASEMNNFQFILHNEQSLSFQWCFSMDSVYTAVQQFRMYLRRNVMRRCPFSTFCLPWCHVHVLMWRCTVHSPGFLVSNNFWMFCGVSRRFDKFPHHDVAGHIPAKLFTFRSQTEGLEWRTVDVLGIKMDSFMFYYGRRKVVI